MTRTLTPTRAVVLDGVATVVSSIIHGGDRAGTVTYLRREQIVQPDGSVEDVPVLSGNALRGILRDHSAEMLWMQLGQPELAMPVFHALWSGGSLAKAGSGKALDPVRLAQLRRLVPHVAIFGAAGGGRIIEGKLRVGKLVPLVTETAHIVPDRLASHCMSTYEDRVQLEHYTRTDDGRKATWRELGAAPQPAALTTCATGALITADPATGEVEPDEETTQMRYGVETLAAGTRLWCSFGLSHVTDLEWAWFCQILAQWTASGGHIGGRSAVGHGRLRLELDEFGSLAPALVRHAEITQQHAEIAAHADAHRAEIIEALTWLS